MTLLRPVDIQAANTDVRCPKCKRWLANVDRPVRVRIKCIRCKIEWTIEVETTRVVPISGNIS